MAETTLNLVVLRSPDLEKAREFYRLLGITLVRDQHGSGPEHLTCEMGPTVFEVYPSNGPSNTTTVRLGFLVSSLETTLKALETAGHSVVSPPRASPWGQRAVVADPDGHRIELLETAASQTAPTENGPRRSLAGIWKDHPEIADVEEAIRDYRRRADSDPGRP